MRIWDIHPKKLCGKHLVAEHRELHAIWSIIVNKKKGYSKHPETLRWHGKLKALYLRHEKLVAEFGVRGYNHNSELDERLAVGKDRQYLFVDRPKEQLRILKKKDCGCPIA